MIIKFEGAQSVTINRFDGGGQITVEPGDVVDLDDDTATYLQQMVVFQPTLTEVTDAITGEVTYALLGVDDSAPVTSATEATAEELATFEAAEAAES